MKRSKNVVHIVSTKFVSHYHDIVCLSWIVNRENIQSALDQMLKNSVGILFWLFVDIENKRQIRLLGSHLDHFPFGDLGKLLETETGSVDLLGVSGAECDAHVCEVVVLVVDEFAVGIDFGHDSGVIRHLLYNRSIQGVSLFDDSGREKASKVGLRNIFGIPCDILELSLHKNFWWALLENGLILVNVVAV